jgi:hypothetical protein
MADGPADRSKRNLPPGYFDLQLRFAEAMARAEGTALADSLARNTDFHRRFGLGRHDDGRPAPGWHGYVAGLAGRTTPEARLSWTWRFFLASPGEAAMPQGEAFGCFHHDPPDTAGVLRIHFIDGDRRDGTGPLARAKMPDRRRELQAMFAEVRSRFSAVRSVRGGSWLYHLEAYRRLFPPEYAASCEPLDRLPGYRGLSSWGQFIDHRGALREPQRDRLLANLATLDPRRPSRVFPFPLLRAEAPVGCFFRFLGV